MRRTQPGPLRPVVDGTHLDGLPCSVCHRGVAFFGGLPRGRPLVMRSATLSAFVPPPELAMCNRTYRTWKSVAERLT